MTRKAIIGILALSAVVVLFLATSWIDGAVVRARLARADRSMGTTLPLFAVVHRQVNSGLFSSTVEVTYEFNDKLFKSMAAATASAKKTAYSGEAPPSLTLRHHIQHGPIPGFAMLGLARIDTEVVIPEVARQELRSSIGTDQPLKIVTVLGYLGGGTTRIDSPAFTFNDTRNANRIDWRGIKGRLNFTRGLNSQDGNLTLLGMKILDNKGTTATIGQVRFDYELKRTFKLLYTGKASFTMDRLAIAMPQQTGAGNMEMRDLAYNVVTTASGDYLDMVAKLGVGSLSVATLNSSGVHYDFSLRHLHGPSYAALTEKLRGIYAATLNGDGKAPQQILAPFREFGANMLEHQPELTIEQISKFMPEGAAQMSGKISIPGYAHGDLDSGPMVLLPKIEASIDIAVDEGFLNRDWGPPSPPASHSTAKARAANAPAPPSRLEVMKAQLATLEQQGFVTRHGSQLSSHLEFRHGALTVNGKPMGPPGARH